MRISFGVELFEDRMSKIVVFDSGFGGLTVLSELRKLLPEEEYIYYGDSANAPYGEKGHEELLRLGTAICSGVLSQHAVKCFVIACNTTTSEVWDELTARFADYDFVGIEPALRWAVEENPGKHILVLATTATIRGRRLRARYEELKDRAQITLLAAPNIVPHVEDCTTDTPEFAAYLEDLLRPYRDSVDCVVLGCTHFPFIRHEIREAIGHEVRFYDAAVTVAREVQALLAERGEMRTEASPTPKLQENAWAGDAADSVKQSEPTRETGHGSVIFLNSDPSKIELEERLLHLYEHISRNGSFTPENSTVVS